MRPRVSLSLALAACSLAAVACTALLGDFEEGDSALTDATADTSVADTSLDTAVALDSNVGDAGVDSGADATSGDASGADAGGDASTAVCLPSVCADAGPKTFAFCFSFDNLDGGMPAAFSGGPPAGYGPGRAHCGDALSLLKNQEGGVSPGTMDLPLPEGGENIISFDILVNTISGSVGSREIAAVFGPSGNAPSYYSLRLSPIVPSAQVAIGFENIPEAGATQKATFSVNQWTHVSIRLTRSKISLALDGESPAIQQSLPADVGGTRSPNWQFGGLDEPNYSGLYIDNFVIVTTPVDAGP